MLRRVILAVCYFGDVWTPVRNVDIWKVIICVIKTFYLNNNSNNNNIKSL